MEETKKTFLINAVFIAMTAKKLSFLREEYRLMKLDLSETHPDPVIQFENWMKDAVRAGIRESNAMVLSTAGKDAVPSSRIVLLKNFDSEGFVFFSNYNSRKGREINENPIVSLNFFWKEIERQVRIQGRVEKTTEAESDAYYLSRPSEARKGAAASPQSQLIPSREWLKERIDNLPSAEWENRPPHWGGFRVRPFLFEFWQGREHRLHDRIQYRLVDGAWIRERLAP